MSLRSSHRKEIPKSAWTWDICTGEVSLGLTFLKLFGEDADHVPADFRLQVKEAFQEAEVHEDKPFYRKTEHLINGKKYYVEWVGEVMERQADGSPGKMAGFAELGSSKDDFTLTVHQEAMFFARIMDNIKESVFFKDLEGRFLKVNKACAEKFGVEDPADIIGKTDFDFFDEEHARPAYEDEQKVIKTEEPIYYKLEREVFKDGQIAWASTSKLPLYDDKGVLIGVFGITRDLTPEMEIKEQLKKRDDLFKSLSEKAPGFLYLHKVEPDGTVSFPFISEGIEDILELQPEELENSMKPLINRVHPDDVREVLLSIQKSVRDQTEWNCEYRVVLPKKGVRWVRGKATPVLQEDGSVLSSGFLSDITESKHIQEMNERLREQFQAVLNAAPNLIFLKGPDGRFIFANKATCEFFGLETDEIEGLKDEDLGIPEEEAEFYREEDQRVLKTGEPLFIPETKAVDKLGNTVYNQTIKVPISLTASNEKGVLTIVTDVTQRKKAELELQETLDLVGDQNKRLQNFAHIVSHNLRNHAGNISMLLSLFDVEESEEEKEELLDFLKQASSQLNESIEDLNEIIDQQYKTQNDLKKLKPAEVIRKVKQILTSEILSHNVAFEEDIDEELEIEYNPAYLESIILNLLSNAIKYRKPGLRPKVTIKLYCEEGHTYFEVSDNGLGIDLEKHGEQLFGMYKTFHGNENSKGIGLFITKNQIESLGGSIDVKSTPGKGTTFKIKLT